VPLLRLGDKRQGQSVRVVPAGGPEPDHTVRGVVNERGGGGITE